MIRLDKYLADMGAGTRSEVKREIARGKVTVDGAVIRRPEFKINAQMQVICYQGGTLPYVRYEYYMLNKPAGVVSATQDKNDRTVLDLISNKKRKDLFPVGRLDKDTEGLLLITNDGNLAHRLLAPRKHVDKIYYAEIDGVVTEDDRAAFAFGVDIGEKQPAREAHLEILDVNSDAQKSTIRLTIHEGKFHQVKRMFQAVGKEVVYLKRLSMGTLMLDKKLKPGEYRELTDEELKELC